MIRDLSPALASCIQASYHRGAFQPINDGANHRPASLAYAVKDKKEFRGDSPLYGLAFEMLGIDFFKCDTRHFPKRAYEPLKKYVVDHFKNYTYAFDEVIGDYAELPRQWYDYALQKPLCGISPDATDFYNNVTYSLPTFPFHQGMLAKKQLRRAFESKIRRTDQTDWFLRRGFPKSPWDQDDMITSYLYGIMHPELWAGMWAWQFTTSQMMAALYDSCGELTAQYSKEWLSNYRHYADMLSRVSVKPLFSIFLLPGIAIQQFDNQANDLSAQDITRGLLYGFSKGAWSSSSRSDDGVPLKFSCPFTGAGSRLLMLELAGGQRSLASFCQKMKTDSDAQPFLTEVRQQLAEHLLLRCNQKVLKRFMRLERGQHIFQALKNAESKSVLMQFINKIGYLAD